jgi:hypothetical protein
MAEEFIYSKQISLSNYSTKEQFFERINHLVNDYYANTEAELEKMKKDLQASDREVLVTGDIANFWEGHVELRFDFVDFENADHLTYQIEFMMDVMQDQAEYKDANILINLVSYFPKPTA